MSVWGGRFTLMRETRSVASMARETGLPYRITLQIASGARIPTSQQLKPLNQLYRRQTYTMLRESGLSSWQASRFRGMAVTSTASMLSDVGRKIHEFTTGIATLQHRIRQKKGLPDTFQQVYDEFYGLVKEGVSKSLQTWEQIRDYGS